MKLVMVQDKMGCRLIAGDTGRTIARYSGRVEMKRISAEIARVQGDQLWNRKRNGVEVRVELGKVTP